MSEDFKQLADNLKPENGAGRGRGETGEGGSNQSCGNEHRVVAG